MPFGATMSHVVCHHCGSNEHYSGYGLGMGPMGCYTVCKCGTLLEFVPDLQGLKPDTARHINADVAKWRENLAMKRITRNLRQSEIE